MIKQNSALVAFVVCVAAAAIVPFSSARTSDCRAVRAVFYTSSDWQRLAQGLAADASPCASYYVTIPALAADKTQMVPNRASSVRALGANLHAAAEVNYSAWQGWVNSTGNSWYAAGQEVRRRMTAAGFNISAGDTWAVNELSSAVRTGAGSARQNVRDLVRGLYDGDGSAQTKGIVFVVGTGQNSLSFPQYKANLESWLQDAGFWTDMTSYVSDFFQEVYGDVRNYAIAGADPASRAALLNSYLQHPLTLALAPGAPGTTAGSRSFLSSAYGPLANASWGWASAYGWTQVGSDVMADYISAQTYAMRLTGEPHIGFAWNPLNSQNLSSSDYVGQIGGVLARLAGAIQETDGGDPSAACLATGCSATIDGASAVTGWSTFTSWTPTAAVFTNPPATLTPSTPSNAFTLQLQTGTAPTTLPVPLTLTISSSSPTTTFSTGISGPWTPTLTQTLAPGSAGAVFYALDTGAGTPKFSVNLNGVVTSQTETVGQPAAAVPEPPPTAHVASAAFAPQQGRLHVTLQVTDANGRPISARVSFAVLHGTSTFLTTVGQSGSDGRIAVTGFPRLQLGCYSARVHRVTSPGYAWDASSPTDTFCVHTLPARVGAVSYGRKNRHLHVGVRVVDDSGHAVRAFVSFKVLRGTTTYASASGRTKSDGWFAVTSGKKLAKGCYHTQVTAVAAHSFRWDHVTGSNHYCVARARAH
jgi:hypothetical protein